MTTLNFNVGVLGHVDSGKTTLSKALSTVASTACFDKNPQSQQRGITLDLGFSSFTLPAPERLNPIEFVQYTLVDCPGHASLIKTIIGGAQIIDLMLLVIDIVKGVQTQTAECLVVGEVCCDKLLVVLSKLDLVSEETRDATVSKMTKRLLKTLEGTKFAGSPVVAVATVENQPLNIDLLVNALKDATSLPMRSAQGPFLFAVDHCFTIRGQGTVMTGTVLSGSVNINDSVEIPALKQQKKVKSIQVFRKPVEKAMQGDRCGICLASLDAKQFERGLVCVPGLARPTYAAIISLQKIRHFKTPIISGSRFHITIGHETITGRLDLFSPISFTPDTPFSFSEEYIHVDEFDEASLIPTYALIDFTPGHDSDTSSSVLCVEQQLLIGSRLDADVHLNQCRIAFHGKAIHLFINKTFREKELAELRVFKEKRREGMVERKHDESTIIGKGLFKKETNLDLFNGLKVSLSSGEKGIIEGGFGQSGKFKVRIMGGLLKETIEKLDKTKTKRKPNDGGIEEGGEGPIKITLEFKKFIYSDKKKICQ